MKTLAFVILPAFWLCVNCRDGWYRLCKASLSLTGRTGCAQILSVGRSGKPIRHWVVVIDGGCHEYKALHYYHFVRSYGQNGMIYRC